MNPGLVKLRIADLIGVGALPYGPGTWGSLASLLLLYPLTLAYGHTGLLLALLAGIVLTLWTAEAAESAWGGDPPRMVIDEFAGQVIPLFWLPFTGSVGTDFLWLLAAFLLFRFFDIAKPLGIDRLQQLPSGFGILIDDLLAGCYALICLQAGMWLFSIL